MRVAEPHALDLDDWRDAKEAGTLPQAEVGLPCSHGINGDSYPCVIVEVRRKGQEIVIAPLKKIDGLWVESSRSTALHRTYTKRRDGVYREKGKDYGTLYIGLIYNHQSPEF